MIRKRRYGQVAILLITALMLCGCASGEGTKRYAYPLATASPEDTVTQLYAEKFAEGVNIGTEDEPEITMPGKLDIIKSDDLSEIRLTIQEGKFHQVKRMFQAVGKEVVYLKRERMGSLILDDNLAGGEYRMLTEEELKNLLF